MWEDMGRLHPGIRPVPWPTVGQAMATSPFAALSPNGVAAGSAWSQGSPFSFKVSDLPAQLLAKVSVAWASLFGSIIAKRLPGEESKAMLQALEQFAVDGLLEARSFLAVLLEAKAYTDIQMLPPPSVPADIQRVASVTQKLQEATKERNERR